MTFRERRRVLTGIGAGIATAIAGCMGGSGDSGEENQKEDKLEAYRFYFDDEADTLGGAGDTQIPEDATDEQIVTNERSEDEWQEMQLNDVEYARFAFNHRGIHNLTEGSVEQVEQKTLELYQERQNSQEYQDQHDAEIFTESVLDAVLEVTDASTGPAQSYLVKTTADYIAANNDEIDIESYKLSEGRSMIGDAGGEKFTHPIGLLQYEENGGTQVRYAEIENRFNDPHARPEESVYATPIGSNTDWSDSGPSDWVSIFDYEKVREMEEMGEIYENSSLGRKMSLTLINLVDDVGIDGTDWDQEEVGKDTEYNSELIDSVISDSFGSSIENYVKNPGEEYTREDLETTARAFFAAAEAENFGGHFILDGDISNPEIYKEESETLEEIRADMDYSSQNIAGKMAT